MEVTKEGRGIVMRVPVDGGGRLVVEMNATEATDLLNALKGGRWLSSHSGDGIAREIFSRAVCGSA